MVTKKIAENAHKVVYIIQQFPQHTMKQVIDLLQMPALDINTAIWAAVQEGYISEPHPHTGMVKLLKTPKTYEFGEQVDDLKKAIAFSFQHLSAKKIDLEENYLAQWTQGYAPQDILVAMRQLLSEKLLAEYAIEDSDSTYIFYTLYPNRKKQWGRAQFKVDPLAEDGDEEAPQPAPVKEK